MITVMRYNYKTGSSRGFYSDHFKKEHLVVMESSILAKMFIDKNTGYADLESYLLVFKNDDNEEWWEITKGVKLDDFCSKKFKFAFINLDTAI